MVRIFPNSASSLCLIWALATETRDAWVTSYRYLEVELGLHGILAIPGVRMKTRKNRICVANRLAEQLATHPTPSSGDLKLEKILDTTCRSLTG